MMASDSARSTLPNRGESPRRSRHPTAATTPARRAPRITRIAGPMIPFLTAQPMKAPTPMRMVNAARASVP